MRLPLVAVVKLLHAIRVVAVLLSVAVADVPMADVPMADVVAQLSPMGAAVVARRW